MILDSKLEFSNAQAVTATAASTNAIDIGLAAPNIGDGTPKRVEVIVNTNFATCDSLKATLEESADDSTYTTLLDGVAVAVASLKKGKKLLSVPLPTQHKRYLRINYTIAGSNATAGKVDAFVCESAQTA